MNNAALPIPKHYECEDRSDMMVSQSIRSAKAGDDVDDQPGGHESVQWCTEDDFSDHDFARLVELIRNRAGISLKEAKRTMLLARVQKRLRALGIRSYAEYCRFLFGPEAGEKEMVALIDVVSTNTTNFFREPHHFEFLTDEAIPKLKAKGLLQHQEIKVWSAACSSGQEPYTLAMVLAEHAHLKGGPRWSVFATDISTRVLEKAVHGVYREEDVEEIPLHLRQKYFLRSKDNSRKLVRVVPTLREAIWFQQLNFMHEPYAIPRKFEVVFCRNAIIYFDHPTQYAILQRISRHLVTGGFLFLGHSESLNGLDLPYRLVGNTVYQKIGETE